MSVQIEAITYPSDTIRAEVEALAGAFEPAWHTHLNAAASPAAWYLARDKDRLVGFLTVFAPVAESAEVSAFVDPEHRREGIFTDLLDHARTLWGPRRWLLVADRASSEASAVSRRLGTLAFTESTLALELSRRPSFHGLPEGLTLADAHAEDVDAALGVLDRANNDESGGHKDFLCQVVADPERRLVILRDGDRAVGAGGLHFGDSTGLFALAIDPDHQGKGWGRALVLGLLDVGAARGREFVIDVDSTNDRAEKLYRSVGFTDRQVTDYYELPGGSR